MMGTKILWRPHPRFRARDDDADGNGDDDDYDGAPSNDNEMARGGGGAPPSENDHRRGGRAEDDDDNGGGAQDRHHLPTTMELMDRSLVVGQEVSLAAMLLAVHGEIVNREEEEGGGSGGGRRGHGGGGRGGLGEILGLCPPSSAAAAAIVYSSLLVIIYFNLQSQSPTSSSSSSSSLSSLGGHHRPRRRRPPPGRRRVAAVRLSDGALLAALLRLLSGALRSLTASYSADTVYALAVCGMSIHLLGCDYAYANGVGGAIVNDVDDDGGVARAFVGAPSPPSSGGDGAPTSASASTSASGGEDADRHPRPPFLGGTVSLNAAFFSTVLLSSRVRSDVASYAFVSSVVTLFAFYPASRHNIAGRYPNSIREWHRFCFPMPGFLPLFFVSFVYFSGAPPPPPSDDIFAYYCAKTKTKWARRARS